MPGLSASVEVVRDDHGIPQLYADTDADLMRAQGYVHAQERFFEMDVRRHVTAGRLSELFGDRRPRDRQDDPHDGLAPGRRAGAGAARPRDARRADGVRRGGQRLPRRRTAPPRSPSSTASSPRPGSTTRPSSGSPSTRSPGSRRWRGTCAATWTTRSTGCCSRSTTPTTRSPSSGRTTPSTSTRRSSSSGGVVDGVFEQNATGNATRNPRRPAYPRDVVDALERVQERGRGDPRPDRQGPRHRLQLVGRRRRAQRDRHAAARQRPAPRHQPAGHLDADGPALPRA